MPDDDTDARLAAHRAAIAALAMVLNEIAPGTFDGVIEALSTFEHFARQQNEPDGMLDELRILREQFAAMRHDLPGPRVGTPAPPPEGEPGPSAPSGPTS